LFPFFNNKTISDIIFQSDDIPWQLHVHMIGAHKKKMRDLPPCGGTTSKRHATAARLKFLLGREKNHMPLRSWSRQWGGSSRRGARRGGGAVAI
jgi:hypothetical protein